MDYDKWTLSDLKLEHAAINLPYNVHDTKKIMIDRLTKHDRDLSKALDDIINEKDLKGEQRQKLINTIFDKRVAGIEARHKVARLELEKRFQERLRNDGNWEDMEKGQVEEKRRSTLKMLQESLPRGESKTNVDQYRVHHHEQTGAVDEGQPSVRGRGVAEPLPSINTVMRSDLDRDKFSAAVQTEASSHPPGSLPPKEPDPKAPSTAPRLGIALIDDQEHPIIAPNQNAQSTVSVSDDNSPKHGTSSQKRKRIPDIHSTERPQKQIRRENNLLYGNQEDLSPPVLTDYIAGHSIRSELTSQNQSFIFIPSTSLPVQATPLFHLRRFLQRKTNPSPHIISDDSGYFITVAQGELTALNHLYRVLDRKRFCDRYVLRPVLERAKEGLKEVEDDREAVE